MNQKADSRKKNKTQKNPLEALIEPVFGNYADRYREAPQQPEQPSEKQPQRRKETVFNFREHYERETVQQEIQQLMQQIKLEIEALKKSGNEIVQEVKEVEKMTVESLPSSPGVYHVRFLEVVLSLLRTVRMKMGESKTWLEAMMSKKKKRGSLFATRSKKMGTQYSLSQELQSARSIQ